MIEEKTISNIRQLTASLFENSINELEVEKTLNKIHKHFQ